MSLLLVRCGIARRTPGVTVPLSGAVSPARWQVLGGLLALALGAGPAAGQQAIYVCTDATGRTFSGDRVPPECVNRTVRELRGDGSVRRVIEPPAAAGQKPALPTETAEEGARAREQARRDALLLERYKDAGDVEAARQRALADSKVRIERAQERLRALQAERQQLAQEAEFYRSRPWPPSLRRAHDSVDERERGERELIRGIEEEVRRINGRFDAERDRLAELLSANPRPPRSSPRRDERELRR